VNPEQELLEADAALLALEPEVKAARLKLEAASEECARVSKIVDEAKANWDNVETKFREAEERCKKAQAAMRGPFWKRFM
jgi:hypothetical protein